MILDYDNPMAGQDGVVIFPDFSFTEEPQQGVGPGPVGREVVVIAGNSTRGTSYITGCTNDPGDG